MMAKYTITIKTLIDNNFNFKMDSYPIFDENYRNTLNQKLNEIMPYYNELYKVQKKLIDENLLLNNVNLTETLHGSNKTETSSTSQSLSNGKNLYQDTPQGQISQTDIDNQTWATNLTLNKNKIEDESNATGNGTNEYLKTIIGNNGGKFNIDVLNDIKNNLLNIDMMIINDLNELFMQIF